MAVSFGELNIRKFLSDAKEFSGFGLCLSEAKHLVAMKYREEKSIYTLPAPKKLMSPYKFYIDSSDTEDNSNNQPVVSTANEKHL